MQKKSRKSISSDILLIIIQKNNNNVVIIYQIPNVNISCNLACKVWLLLTINYVQKKTGERLKEKKMGKITKKKKLTIRHQIKNQSVIVF